MKTFNPTDTYDIIYDINRVETTCFNLVNQIEALLHIHLTLSIKTDWNREDLPTVEHMERIRSNIETIRQVLDPSYSIPTFANKFNYENANDFEIALDYMYLYLKELMKVISQPIAGLYYAGDPLLLITERS